MENDTYTLNDTYNSENVVGWKADEIGKNPLVSVQTTGKHSAFHLERENQPKLLHKFRNHSKPFGDYSLRFTFECVAPPQVWGLQIMLRNFLINACGILTSWNNLINGCRLLRSWSPMINVVTMRLTNCCFLHCKAPVTEFISVTPSAKQCSPPLSHEIQRIVNKLRRITQGRA